MNNKESKIEYNTCPWDFPSFEEKHLTDPKVLRRVFVFIAESRSQFTLKRTAS